MNMNNTNTELTLEQIKAYERKRNSEAQERTIKLVWTSWAKELKLPTYKPISPEYSETEKGQMQKEQEMKKCSWLNNEKS